MVSLIRTQLNVILDSVDEIRVRGEWSTDGDDQVVILVLVVNGLLGGSGLVATSDHDGGGFAVGVEEEVELLGCLDIGVSGDARLDDVRVGQLELGELLGQVGELGDGVFHAHALEWTPGTETDAGLVGANGGSDGLGDFEGETGAVLNAAAPGISALVAGVLGELVDQIAVGAVDLDTVEASFDGVLGGLSVVSDEAPDLLLRQSSRGRRVVAHGDSTAGDQLVTIRLEVVSAGGPAQSPELNVDKRALGVHCICDLLPRRNLLLAVDSGNVGVSSIAGRDEGSLGDDQSSGHRGALFIVVLHEGQRHMGIVRTETSHGRHGKALGQLDLADLDGGEELRHGENVVDF